MTVPYFLDSNVLLYAALGRLDAPRKWAKAVELIAGAEFGTSTQVMQEFYRNAIRKTAVPLTPAEAMKWIESLERLPLVIVDVPLIKAAALVCERYKITYWDSAILAAAERLEAPLVYSEGLNHTQNYGSVRVENPFRGL